MRRASVSVALALCVLALAAAAAAQVPEKMNYQVMLTNDLDEPLSDQAVTLVFRIYDAEGAGTLKWSETHSTTTNSIGIAQVILGSIGTIHSPDFVDPLWLEVEVNGETLSPRRELVSAPYAFYAADSDALGGFESDDYTLDLELSVPGSVNDPGNPVDWTKLKNVPAGFADGADDTGGSGDGHSLDADDGSPVDALYVNANGNVGIGLTTPANRLTLHDSATGIVYEQFSNSTTGTTANDGFEIGVNGVGHAFINQQEALSLFFLTNGVQRASINEYGVLRYGSSSSRGSAEFYAGGPVAPVVHINPDPTYGGNIELYDETGIPHSYLEADINGTGGYFAVLDGNEWGGFYVDGSALAGDAMISIIGSQSSSYFETGLTSDDAVSLPNNAVADYEILDEAGTASNSATASIFLSGPVETLLSRSITVPAPGYVFAAASAEIEIDHGASYSGASFGVSDNDYAIPDGGKVYHRVPGGATQGVWMPGISVQGLFEVSAGTHTFYFLADLVSGSWRINDQNLVLLYVPTAYGSIARTVASPPTDPELRTEESRPALTDVEIAAERAESEAANSARIERELAEMEARIAELRASLGNEKP